LLPVYLKDSVAWHALQLFAFALLQSLKKTADTSKGFGAFGRLKYNLLVVQQLIDQILD